MAARFICTMAAAAFRSTILSGFNFGGGQSCENFVEPVDDARQFLVRCAPEPPCETVDGEHADLMDENPGAFRKARRFALERQRKAESRFPARDRCSDDDLHALVENIGAQHQHGPTAGLLVAAYRI